MVDDNQSLSVSSGIFGWIYLLPTESIKVIVKYHPKWMISCILPETRRQIFVSCRDFDSDIDCQKSIKIDVPSLILSHSIKKPWAIHSKIKEYFSIHAIDLSKSDNVYALPYRFANVYSSGTICFGDVALDGLPKNLRQANNFFWSTQFNEDNSPFFDMHYSQCRQQEHDYYAHPWHICINYPDSLCSCLCCKGVCRCECKCECCTKICGCRCCCNLTKEFFEWVPSYFNYIKEKQHVIKTKLFCGNKYFAYPDKAGAVFLSNKKKLLNEIPEKHWRFDPEGTSAIIGIAEQSGNSWKINLGSFEFTIKNTQVTIM
jgi:hypothetical protein